MISNFPLIIHLKKLFVYLLYLDREFFREATTIKVLFLMTGPLRPHPPPPPSLMAVGKLKKARPLKKELPLVVESTLFNFSIFKIYT